MFLYRACLLAACLGTAHVNSRLLCLLVVGSHIWQGIAFALAGLVKRNETLAMPTRVEAAEDMFGGNVRLSGWFALIS